MKNILKSFIFLIFLSGIVIPTKGNKVGIGRSICYTKSRSYSSSLRILELSIAFRNKSKTNNLHFIPSERGN